jgi:hypothetical protein
MKTTQMIDRISIETDGRLSDPPFKSILKLLEGQNYIVEVSGEILETYKYKIVNNVIELYSPFFETNRYSINDFLSILGSRFWIIFGMFLIKDMNNNLLISLEVSDTAYYIICIYSNDVEYFKKGIVSLEDVYEYIKIDYL